VLISADRSALQGPSSDNVFLIASMESALT
jgi:hypothetical protein